MGALEPLTTPSHRLCWRLFSAGSDKGIRIEIRTISMRKADSDETDRYYWNTGYFGRDHRQPL